MKKNKKDWIAIPNGYATKDFIEKSKTSGQILKARIANELLYGKNAHEYTVEAMNKDRIGTGNHFYK